MLDTLVAIALEAGKVILEVYEGDDLGAQAKGDGSPVTVADGLAEAVILKGLAQHFPGVPVVAEEAVAAGDIPELAERYFLVDPLDGTKDFIKRNGEFTVNIALMEAHRPIAGVVYAPAIGDLYAGDRTGARRAEVKDGQPGPWRVIQVAGRPAGGLRVVASRSHAGADTTAYLERFEVAQILPSGSSLKLCKVATGEADLYPRMGRTMAWDIAAGDAVLRGAGGLVRTLDGRPFTYEPNRVGEGLAFQNPWFVASGGFDPAEVEGRR